MLRGRIQMLVPLAAAAVLVLAATAWAQTSPTTQVYGGDQNEVIGEVGKGVVPPADQPRGGAGEEEGTPTAPVPARAERGAAPVPGPGELPFTGFEAALVALAGMALVATGFALRRAARPPAA